jgi:hypothetical protein
VRVRLSLIIPTRGGRSLASTLRSLRGQTFAGGDEVLLVAARLRPPVGTLFRQSGLPGRCAEIIAPGAARRNRAPELAAGDYLLFLEDSDALVPGALSVIRDALRQLPGRPHLFRVRYASSGRVVWTEPTIARGNVRTPMAVLPNRPDRLGRWDGQPGRDFRFLRGTLSLWPPGSLVWRPEVIADIRPRGPNGRGGPALDGAEGGLFRVEDCTYREQVRWEGGVEVAVCGLVQQLSGAEDPLLSAVRRDACTACCRSSPPSPGALNPVIASLLYEVAERVRAAGGVPGCPAGRVTGLQNWARHSLSREPARPRRLRLPVRTDRPCCHLGPEIGFRLAGAGGPRRIAVCACRHPGHRETTADDCARCRDWADRPEQAPVPIEQLVPPPAVRRGPAVRRWAVGVTTAPRRQPTLAWCLDSLARAGWDRPRLFMDSAVAVPERHRGLPVSLRDSRLGAWPNYYLAVAELLMRDPHADAYLLVQDDVVFYDRQDLRAYLERSLWPAEPVGAVSLFCSRAYTRPRPGWHRRRGRWVWGAQAFAFPRTSAKRLVADPYVLEHRWGSRHGGLAYIDVLLGEWAARHGLPIYYPSPSLAQHVGDTSTLWPDSRADGGRSADQFAGDLG